MRFWIVCRELLSRADVVLPARADGGLSASAFLVSVFLRRESASRSAARLLVSSRLVSSRLVSPRLGAIALQVGHIGNELAGMGRVEERLLLISLGNRTRRLRAALLSERLCDRVWVCDGVGFQRLAPLGSNFS